MIGDPAFAGNWIGVVANNIDAVHLEDGANASTTIQNSIRGNSIAVQGSGQEISLNGATDDGSVNNPGGVRFGANTIVDYPDLSGVTLSGSQFVLSGTYSGVPFSHLRIDIYQQDPTDPNSFFNYLQTNELLTDSAGNCPFQFALQGGLASFSVAASATDDAGNTSQYSAVTPVIPEVFQFSTGTSGLVVNEAASVIHLTISRDGDLRFARHVQYSTQDATAIAGVDYLAVAGFLTFGIGQASAQVDIPIINNLKPNGERHFNVTLSNPDVGIIGPQGSVAVSLLDNQAPYGVFTVSGSTPFFDKGSAASVAMVIKRSGGMTGSVTVNYATANGTALAGKDYTAKSGAAVFASGQSAVTISVPMLANKTYQANRTFLFKLVSCSAGAALGTSATAVQTICDPGNPSGMLEFTAAKYNANESGTNLIVTISRLGGTTGIVTTRFDTLNSTALAGLNYVPASRLLTFKSGIKSLDVQVALLDDYVWSVPDNQFLVSLSAPTNGATLGGIRTSTITEIDCDNPGGVFQFSGTAVTAVKNAVAVTIQATRLGDTTGAVTVPFTFQDGTARSGVTYVGRAGAFSFADGVTSATTNVVLVTNARTHPAQSFTMNLGTPSGTAKLGAQKSITITIPAK